MREETDNEQLYLLQGWFMPVNIFRWLLTFRNWSQLEFDRIRSTMQLISWRRLTQFEKWLHPPSSLCLIHLYFKSLWFSLLVGVNEHPQYLTCGTRLEWKEATKVFSILSTISWTGYLKKWNIYIFYFIFSFGGGMT